jgi:hypothetical protein
MAITLGEEVALAIHSDQTMTYGDIETALVTAGFSSYTIVRNNNFDDSSDVQLFVRSPRNIDGGYDSLEATDTLTKLGEALTALESTQSDGGTGA